MSAAIHKTEPHGPLDETDEPEDGNRGTQFVSDVANSYAGNDGEEHSQEPVQALPSICHIHPKTKSYTAAHAHVPQDIELLDDDELEMLLDEPLESLLLDDDELDPLLELLEPLPLDDEPLLGELELLETEELEEDGVLDELDADPDELLELMLDEDETLLDDEDELDDLLEDEELAQPVGPTTNPDGAVPVNVAVGSAVPPHRPVMVIVPDGFKTGSR